ncbi:hypothetical protein EYF80_006964 [Liparis tanakae]|uniref:Uncharacterized protein n=1 Tax=Liparis tanakae TaxID=230148 RepID=A0A4Z2IZV4_9TELE|nr:hypothetical protein EYF80_006964 [Liparis tanakae]
MNSLIFRSPTSDITTAAYCAHTNDTRLEARSRHRQKDPEGEETISFQITAGAVWLDAVQHQPANCSRPACQPIGEDKGGRWSAAGENKGSRWGAAGEHRGVQQVEEGAEVVQQEEGEETEEAQEVEEERKMMGQGRPRSNNPLKEDFTKAQQLHNVKWLPIISLLPFQPITRACPNTGIMYAMRDRVRGRASGRSEMAPVVIVFLIREPEAAAPRVGFVKASSLLALFS